MLSFVRRLSSWPSFVLLLTALTILGTSIFFLLHYLGNRIPYDLALQRFESLETEFTSKEYARGYISKYEFCELSASVLRGAESTSDAEGHSLRNAILPQAYGAAGCEELRAALSGEDPEPSILRPRFWWGNKAIFAIGLRFFSSAQLRQVVEFATYLAYGILLAATAGLAPRTTLVMVPVTVFGVFGSGIKYFADVSNGVPYLWAVLAAAILALLMRRQSVVLDAPEVIQRIGSDAAVFCFMAGMVSSYLFFWDGHISYSIALFGLVTWFGNSEYSAKDRAKKIAWFVLFYITGFISCHMLSQIVKAVALAISRDTMVARDSNLLTAILQAGGAVFGAGPKEGPQPLIHGLSLFWNIGMGRIATGEALSILSLVALVIAVLVAVFRGRRGHWGLFQDLLLLLTLMAVVCLNLFIPTDILGKGSRYWFINYSLIWSGLILAILKVSWRLNIAVGGLIIGPSLVWLWVQSNRVEDFRSVHEQLADKNIVIRDHFNVYLDEDYRSLVYVKDECSSKDTAPEFLVRMDTFSELQRFYFEDYGMHFEGKCVAIIPISKPEVEHIRTGQDVHVDSSYKPWKSSYDGRFSSHSAAYDSIAGDEPLFRDAFDVYLGEDYNSLIYVREQCNVAEDALIRNSENLTPSHGFFLHVFPVDSENLAEDRRQHGFDNLGFQFSTNGVLADGRCVTRVDLPNYEIAAIQTGQYVYHTGQYINYWDRISSPFGRLSSYSPEYDSIASNIPLFRDVFDVYLDKNSQSLIYVKERCQISDIEFGFFLHVFPVDSENLAEDRRQHGFDNLGFQFSTNGVLADGRCVTRVDLPNYEIAAIQTGQYVYHTGLENPYVHLWSREIGFQEQGRNR